MLSGIKSAISSGAQSFAGWIQKWLSIITIFLTIILVIEVVIALAMSFESGCVEPYEFDSVSRYVSAKPDDIFGGPYNNENGGEYVNWIDTGLRSDGNEIVIELTGEWTSWDEANTASELRDLAPCDDISDDRDISKGNDGRICPKRDGVDNCICVEGQESAPETDTFGDVLEGVDCSGSDQDDGAKCTCTTNANVNTFGTYYIALDYQNKDESLRYPDDQKSCKYNQGLGLYVGFFGRDGSSNPLRIYQVYPPEEEVCDIDRNEDGKCVDDDGFDRTKYIFKSPGGTAFIKDDKAGNNGTDTNPDDDEYHQAGEVMKFIISDRYYRDNYGGYNVGFLGGFMRSVDTGLLEYVVGTVEDVVLGEIGEDGKRSGGALEFLYKSIVKDSTFIAIVQMMLILYIVIFGIYVLSGALELSRKELTSRIIKISLVIFFTTETSWHFYNQIVVGIFKDSMDFIIAMFMNASDAMFDTTSMIFGAQSERAASVSNATRFSYVDFIIKKLISEPTHKKIWSLFFGEWFGFIYIPMVYALIFVFIASMLHIASAYVKILLALIFALALGPIFMITALFNKTDEIFKRWLSFMGSQSLQIIAIFMVLYLFLILIDQEFTNLFAFQACATTINFGLFNINFMVSSTEIGLMAWMSMILKIGALLYLLIMIIEKIPGLAGQLVIISGQSADTSTTFVKDTNNSAFALGRSLFGSAGKAIKGGLGRMPGAMSTMADGARVVGRKTGISDIIDKSPIRGPAGVYRDSKINELIKKKIKEGKKAGHTDKKLNNFVRNEVKKEFGKDSNFNNLMGVKNEKSIDRNLEKALVKEPLKAFVKNESQKVKADAASKGMTLSRQETQQKVQENSLKWAERNGADKDVVNDYLGKKSAQKDIKQHGTLTSGEAAKAFAGDEKAQDNYLRELVKQIDERQRKNQEAQSEWYKRMANKAKNVARSAQGKAAYNPNTTGINFIAKTHYRENLSKAETWLGGKLESAEKSLKMWGVDRGMEGTKWSRKARERLGEMLERDKEIELKNYVLDDGHEKEVEQIRAAYSPDIIKEAEEIKEEYSAGAGALKSALENAEEKKDGAQKDLLDMLGQGDLDKDDADRLVNTMNSTKSDLGNRIKNYKSKISTLKTEIEQMERSGEDVSDKKRELDLIEMKVNADEYKLSDIDRNIESAKSARDNM